MYKEYIDIKFGNNWASEFNLIAVSVGDRYTPPAYGNINSNTSTVAGKRGVYKWKTQFNEKIFTVNFAFDNLLIRDISKIKTWLNPKKIQKLIFSDEPYKFYYACLNSDPKFEFLPFIEGETKIGSKVIQHGVYKGELSLEFCAIDGVGYSENDSYETVEVEKGLIYKNSEYTNIIAPWVQSSNLLNDEEGYKLAARIYTKSFIDYDTGDPENCGLSSDKNHTFYLLNSGDMDAKLNLSFDLIMIGEQPLVIYTKRVKKINKEEDNNGWESVDGNGIYSVVVIESFKDYIPFIEFIGQENYDILIKDLNDATLTDKERNELLERKKIIMGSYTIEVDSELREIYIKSKTDENKILNINKFNGNREFLRLCDSNFVDYQKPFPTIVSEENETIDPNKIIYAGTAIENVHFNAVFLGETEPSYRLVNVHFNWKHTYN